MKNKSILLLMLVPLLASCTTVPTGSSQDGSGNNPTSSESSGGNNQSSSEKVDLKKKHNAMSLAEAIAQARENGEDKGTEKFNVYGIIKEIKNDEYGEMVLKDDTNELYVYGVNNWTNLSKKPQVGDEIVLNGPLLVYKGKPELHKSDIVEFTGSNGNGGNGGNTDPSSSEAGGSDDITIPSDYNNLNVDQSAFGGYYKDFDDSLRGAPLLGQVRDYMVEKHTHYTSYDDCRGSTSGKYDDTDYDPNNKNNIIMLYTRASIDGKWNSDIYNREHVWPKSLSNGLWGTSNGGSDMHHIRPDFNRTNGQRSSKKFGDNHHKGLYKFTYQGKTYDCAYDNGGVWEPLDNVKGDVARIILYTFTHYNNSSNLDNNDGLSAKANSKANSKGSGSLKITNVIKASSDIAAFKMLTKWSNMDPVDITEINRNNGVARIQGNRNPFIDYPALPNLIWGI